MHNPIELRRYTRSIIIGFDSVFLLSNNMTFAKRNIQIIDATSSMSIPFCIVTVFGFRSSLRHRDNDNKNTNKVPTTYNAKKRISFNRRTAIVAKKRSAAIEQRADTDIILCIW